MSVTQARSRTKSKRPDRSRSTNKGPEKSNGPSATDSRSAGGAHASLEPLVSFLPAVQPQLTIGPVDDPYEREADAVAQRVASGQVSSSATPLRTGAVAPGQGTEEEEEPLQRQPLEEEEPLQQPVEAGEPLRRQTAPEEEEPLQRQMAQDDEEPVQRLHKGHLSLLQRQVAPDEEIVQSQVEEEEPLQRSGDGAPHISTSTAATIRSPGAGNTMPPDVRGRIEPQVGAGLGGVRVHSGPTAARAASALGARAFTHRNHIFLGGGESPRDVRLMAHEATHVVQQGAAVATVPQVQRLFDFSLDDIPGIDAADIARRVPGYTLFTVIIGYNPLTDAEVEPNAITILQGLMELVPFGADIFDALNERGIIQAAVDWVQGELTRLNLSRERILRVLDEAWEEIDLTPPFSISENLDIIVGKFIALYNDVVTFARSLVDHIIEMIREAAIDAAEGLLAENRAWALIKKILGHDPLRDEPVEATPTEILEDFLLLIGKEQHLEQMRERGTVEETANWLATQLETFMSLLGELRALITQAWEAIQPENLPNLMSNLEALALNVGGFLQRVWDFATTVAAEVLRLIKDALLGWLAEYANQVPGFHLLTVIIERNPFTQERVPRTAENLIRGFITLLPNGAAIYSQLSESGTIPQAAARIEGAMAELGISWEFVVGLFTGIWESLSIEDLVQPLEAFTRIVNQFGEPISRLFAFINVVLREMFFIILEMMHFPTDLIGSIISNAMQAIEDIKNDPVGFLMNMLRAVKEGFANFFNNILTHLVGGLADWLFRGLREAGIEPPTDLSLQSVLDFVLEVLGISMERIWEKLAERIGQETVDRIRGAIDRLTGIWTFVKDVQERGVTAIWEYIESQISGLWDMILEQAREWIMERIINRAIQWLLSLLDPTGIMPVINSFIAFFRAVQSAIDYLRDILAIINDYVSTIASVARGAIEPGAQKLEQGLANAIPIAIGFLANQFGLGNIGEKIQEIVAGIRGLIDRALDWLIDRAVRMVQSLLSALGFGGGEEEVQQEELDPSDHRAVALRAKEELETVAEEPDSYAALRREKEEQARQIEERYSAILEEGIGLTVQFGEATSDEEDQELDFDVIVAPNTEKVEGQVEFDVDGYVVTVWTVSEKQIRVTLDPDDPEAEILVARGATQGRVLSDIIKVFREVEGVKINERAARAFIEDLASRGLLKPPEVRTLFISFAQVGPGDPLEYLKTNLKLGRASRAAMTFPTGSAERQQLVNKGVTEEGEQRETLAAYASVFYESYEGQFVARPLQRVLEPGEIAKQEWVYDRDEQPRVRNLGIVRVGDDGSIKEIVEITDQIGSREELIQLMQRAGWKVKL